MTRDEDSPETGNRPSRFVVVTGLSGAGKSQAIRTLEDLGYQCVDNLPTALLPAFADLAVTGGGAGGGGRASAAVLDVRDPHFLDSFPEALGRLRARDDLGGGRDLPSRPAPRPSCAATRRPGAPIRWLPIGPSSKASSRNGRGWMPSSGRRIG